MFVLDGFQLNTADEVYCSCYCYTYVCETSFINLLDAFRQSHGQRPGKHDQRRHSDNFIMTLPYYQSPALNNRLTLNLNIPISPWITLMPDHPLLRTWLGLIANKKHPFYDWTLSSIFRLVQQGDISIPWSCSPIQSVLHTSSIDLESWSHSQSMAAYTTIVTCKSFLVSNGEIF